MHRVLVHNFAHPRLITTASKCHIIHGFEPIREPAKYKRDLGSDFILALLIHEKLCLELAHLSEILNLFGFQDTFQLLESVSK